MTTQPSAVPAFSDEKILDLIKVHFGSSEPGAELHHVVLGVLKRPGAANASTGSLI
jgi:hypothetical protein